MDSIKNIVLVLMIASAFYLVKNIRISVSGAEARSSRADFYDEEPIDEEIIEVKDKNTTKENPRITSRTVAIESSTSPSELDKMVSLIRSKDLCGFEKYAKEAGIGQKQKLEALGASFGGTKFKELGVFADSDIKSYDSYNSLEAKSYILGKSRMVFEGGSWRQKGEFSKGLKQEDQEILEKIEELAARDPNNLFFSALRTDVYMRYKNVDEETQQKLFEKNYAATHFHNPTHSWVRDLYNSAKDNVVQFHLAQKVFENDVSTETGFLGRTIWMIYDENLRYHLNSVLGKALEGVVSSDKAFGYEVGVYNAYRNSLHYTDYEVTPESGEYERSKLQPTYEIGELKLDLSKGCDPNKVIDLEIKLRAL